MIKVRNAFIYLVSFIAPVVLFVVLERPLAEFGGDGVFAIHLSAMAVAAVTVRGSGNPVIKTAARFYIAGALVWILVVIGVFVYMVVND